MTIDRKAARREYAETPRPMGVFRVLDTVNGKCLVGSTVDLPSMLNRQRAQLRLGGHRNHALQDDFRAHGEDAFRFEVLDTIEPSDEPGADPAADLATLEALWIEKLQPFDEHGYHRRPPAPRA